MSHAIEDFFAAWGETEPGAREDMLRNCLSPEISYADPRTPEALSGVEAVSAYVAMYTQYAPGATAKVTNLSETNGRFRANVEFAMSDGNTQQGQYFVEVDAQNRPTRMVGFVGLGDSE